jgi:hypothetical protein
MSPLISQYELRRRGVEAMQEFARTRDVEYRTFSFFRMPQLLRVYRGCPAEYYLTSESTGGQDSPPLLTTHIRAPFPNTSGVRFSLIRRSSSAQGMERHGSHSVETGDAAFDEAFVVKCHEPGLVREFLADPAYRALLIETASGLSIDDRKEDGHLEHRSRDVHYVKLFVHGFLTDVAGIEKAFSLVDRTLDRLAILGQARLAA